jgi:hypothetical protein
MVPIATDNVDIIKRPSSNRVHEPTPRREKVEKSKTENAGILPVSFVV